jgi:hypothetical protein
MTEDERAEFIAIIRELEPEDIELLLMIARLMLAMAGPAVYLN